MKLWTLLPSGFSGGLSSFHQPLLFLFQLFHLGHHLRHHLMVSSTTHLESVLFTLPVLALLAWLSELLVSVSSSSFLFLFLGPFSSCTTSFLSSSPSVLVFFQVFLSCHYLFLLLGSALALSQLYLHYSCKHFCLLTFCWGERCWRPALQPLFLPLFLLYLVLHFLVLYSPLLLQQRLGCFLLSLLSCQKLFL